MSPFPHPTDFTFTTCHSPGRPISPYRAPELLFGTRTYDAKALDLWSLGATFAEFFTPLKLSDKESDAFDFGFGRDEPLPPEEEDELGIPFITPKTPSLNSTRPIWDRKSLFDGTRGEIGLAWSIFKVRGTANDANWPVSAYTHTHREKWLGGGWDGDGVLTDPISSGI